MQEADAQRRLALLRGEIPPPIEDDQDEGELTAKNETAVAHESRRLPAGMRPKRRRAGEDDTDWEMRLAKERSERGAGGDEREPRTALSGPLVDRHGHISLFGDERSRAHSEKNEEAERESRQKKREYEDQYTMRFSNAAGRGAPAKPWYSQSDDGPSSRPSSDSRIRTDHQDPRRREREARRVAAADPLTAMKRGAAKVREVKQERRRFRREQEEAMQQMRREYHDQKSSAERARGRSSSPLRPSEKRRERRAGRVRYDDDYPYRDGDAGPEERLREEVRGYRRRNSRPPDNRRSCK